MKKIEWLNQEVMFDEWGRPPSLADVPLHIGTRREMLERRGLNIVEVNNLYKEEVNAKKG